jgi:hypothetical protein
MLSPGRRQGAIIGVRIASGLACATKVRTFFVARGGKGAARLNGFEKHEVRRLQVTSTNCLIRQQIPATIGRCAAARQDECKEFRRGDEVPGNS